MNFKWHGFVLGEGEEGGWLSSKSQVGDLSSESQSMFEIIRQRRDWWLSLRLLAPIAPNLINYGTLSTVWSWKWLKGGERRRVYCRIHVQIFLHRALSPLVVYTWMPFHFLRSRDSRRRNIFYTKYTRERERESHSHTSQKPSQFLFLFPFFFVASNTGRNWA
jgi:hypothetical protein